MKYKNSNKSCVRTGFCFFFPEIFVSVYVCAWAKMQNRVLTVDYVKNKFEHFFLRNW